MAEECSASRGECITGIFEALDRIAAYLADPDPDRYWDVRDELGDIENALGVAQDELADAYRRLGLDGHLE